MHTVLNDSRSESPRRAALGRALAATALVSAIAYSTVTQAEPPTGKRHARPYRMLVDEYRHHARPDTFTLGFSLDEAEQKRAYHYGTDVTGHVNGFFSLSQLIADDFEMVPSREPIDGRLIERADAYLIACPPNATKGGPNPLTAEDAEHLESFVEQGGMLVLIYNSVGDPAAPPGLDFEGMNRIARRFGVEILPTQTRSLLIPIPRDTPALFASRHLIYGNGCTFALHPQAGTDHAVLAESSNPDVPGPVAVRARQGKGAVLFVGDAGVFGNAHLARTDTDHARTVQRLFRTLLPDGPLPGYGWKPGVNLRVSLDHTLGISGAPNGMRLLDLPLDPAARISLTGVREIDIQSAPQPGAGTTQPAGPPPASGRYALAKAHWNLTAHLEAASGDDRVTEAVWRGPDDSAMSIRITPRGEVLDASAHSGTLTDWRWALTNAVIVAIDPAAQVGDTWSAPAYIAIPNTQLRPTPMLREVQADFRLARRETLQGRPCLVVTRRSITPLDDLRPQDLVDPAFADYFDSQKVRLRHAAHTELLTAWIDAETRLPVRTELDASTVYWWTDRNEEDRYISDHDHRVFETSQQTRRVTILGRKLVTDFAVVAE